MDQYIDNAGLLRLCKVGTPKEIFDRHPSHRSTSHIIDQFGPLPLQDSAGFNIRTHARMTKEHIGVLSEYCQTAEQIGLPESRFLSFDN